jgi:hypothetical protein
VTIRQTADYKLVCNGKATDPIRNPRHSRRRSRQAEGPPPPPRRERPRDRRRRGQTALRDLIRKLRKTIADSEDELDADDVSESDTAVVYIVSFESDVSLRNHRGNNENVVVEELGRDPEATVGRRDRRDLVVGGSPAPLPLTGGTALLYVPERALAKKHSGTMDLPTDGCATIRRVVRQIRDPRTTQIRQFEVELDDCRMTGVVQNGNGGGDTVLTLNGAAHFEEDERVHVRVRTPHARTHVHAFRVTREPESGPTLHVSPVGGDEDPVAFLRLLRAPENEIYVRKCISVDELYVACDRSHGTYYYWKDVCCGTAAPPRSHKITTQDFPEHQALRRSTYRARGGAKSGRTLPRDCNEARTSSLLEMERYSKGDLKESGRTYDLSRMFGKPLYHAEDFVGWKHRGIPKLSADDDNDMVMWNRLRNEHYIDNYIAKLGRTAQIVARKYEPKYRALTREGDEDNGPLKSLTPLTISGKAMVHGLWTHYFAAIGNFPSSHRYGPRRPFPRYAHGPNDVDDHQRNNNVPLYEGENMREEYEHWRNYNNFVQVNCSRAGGHEEKQEDNDSPSRSDRSPPSRSDRSPPSLSVPTVLPLPLEADTDVNVQRGN